MMDSGIAIVGLACRYPDASTPHALWENVLCQRRAFRRLPPERLRLEDFAPTGDSGTSADSIYLREAALLEGYAFDRIRFRVGGDSFRVTDLAHWLALDVASEALADAGFEDADGLPRDETGVLVGNTLTSEFSRAHTLRLRWPYVRRQAVAALAEEGWTQAQIDAFLPRLEARYKEPFPGSNDASLAGGLANTIAGRIANQFDLHGGGYTVDGACASSLLAVNNACSAIALGDLEVAVVGGVDLSLDPFELVGFSRLGALAEGEMRVFDRRPTGFLPGEGCGFAVLMRHADAVAQGRRIYAVIRGWGISSDGKGGLTRPEVAGQQLALKRAYKRAGYGIDSVALFEGHGTGTAVGDAVELTALNRARREAGADGTEKAALGSIKANIGHTKAAAGLAGLIKASMALHQQVIPPMTGCSQPHEEILGEASSLRIPRDAEPWSQQAPLRAGLSAMGFGGINTHVALEAPARRRRRSLTAIERRLIATPQDAELIVLGGRDEGELRQRVEQLLRKAAQLSRAELTDLAAELSRALHGAQRLELRAAIVAATPSELDAKLQTLHGWLDDAPAETRLDLDRGLFLARPKRSCRVGLLFPGQGSPSHLDGGLWKQRFSAVRALYRQLDEPASNGTETAVAQPAIVTASLAGLAILEALGLEADAALGHSLGELVALHWAGSLEAESLRELATARGRAMSRHGAHGGAMASLAAAPERVADLLQLDGSQLSIASYNGRDKTVVAGPAEAIEQVLGNAREAGISAIRLPVSHAFHSPLMAGAVEPLRRTLADLELAPAEGRVASTITGSWLEADADLRALLADQLTEPVRFTAALDALAQEVDVLVEVGPGHTLTALARSSTDLPAVAIDAGGPTLGGLLNAVGALFCLGAPVDPAALFLDRFTRPFDLERSFDFLVNPCELAPVDSPPAMPAGNPVPVEDTGPAEDTVAAKNTGAAANIGQQPPIAAERAATERYPAVTSDGEEAISPIAVVGQLLAERTELPLSAISEDSRLLTDLHLSSIAVSELVTQAAHRLHLEPPVAPTEYANATVGELAEALAELAEAETRSEGADAPPAGVAGWVRPFAVEWVERPRRASSVQPRRWQIISHREHPWRDGLEQALAGGTAEDPTGVALLLEGREDDLDLLLRAGKRTLQDRQAALLVIQPALNTCGAAAFARTLHLESPDTPVTVIDLPAGSYGPGRGDDPDQSAWRGVLAAESTAMRGFLEVRYDAQRRRYQPQLRALDQPATRPEPEPLGEGDVILVSGGGKGIGAESALVMAQKYRARLAILGRSKPEDDAELARNLERFEAHGVSYRYLRTDVGDRREVAAAVAEATRELGPIRAIVHSAGTNVPKLIDALEREDLERTLAPKVVGLENLLAAVERDRLRLLIGFGSIIGRLGLRGQADYALANESLRLRIERFAAAHPRCRSLCLEWSVWSGIGMGARLADLDLLARQGITPISPEAGIGMLEELLERPTPVALVVAGRFGQPATLEMARPELPLGRFLEQPRLYVPGVELIVDASLSNATDPYLADHVFGDEQLFAAVLGLEAMAQTSLALLETADASRLVFRDLRFERPVVVPADEPITLRLAALKRGGEVEVALRSSRTAFQVDHFRAVVTVDDLPAPSRLPLPAEEQPLFLEPRDLYGPVLFQQGRFERVRGYRHLRATECLAELGAGSGAAWFGSWLPQDMILGDPGARDATIHAVQACIPHATVLPVAVERLSVYPAASRAGAERRVFARERSSDGQTLIYDLEVWNADGEPIERWEGLRLHAIEKRQLPTLAAPLLGPYLERRLKDLLPRAALRVAVTNNGVHTEKERKEISARVVAQALGQQARVVRRPDGKPEAVDSAEQVSIAHGGDMVLAVAANSVVGCDIEAVERRPAGTWQDLLGERYRLLEVLAQDHGGRHAEGTDELATRVWTAIECLKKAGSPLEAPLLYSQSTDDGWLLFSSGHLTAATVLLDARSGDRIAVATVVDGGDEETASGAPASAVAEVPAKAAAVATVAAAASAATPLREGLG